VLPVLVVTIAAFGLSNEGFSECTPVPLGECGYSMPYIPGWQPEENRIPCVWEGCESCDGDPGGLVAQFRGNINNPGVVYAYLFDWDGDGFTTGTYPYDPVSPEYGLELPDGIAVSQVFVEGDTFWGPGYTPSAFGVRFQAAPQASEGPFTVPIFFDVFEEWSDPPGYWNYKTYRFVFKGHIAIEDAKLVVKATSLTPSNPDHGQVLWFTEADSEWTSLPNHRFLNDDWLDLLMYTSEAPAAYKFQVYRENNRPVTLGSLEIVHAKSLDGKGVYDDAYCVTASQSGACAQQLVANAALPKFDGPPTVGGRLGSIGGGIGGGLVSGTPYTFYLRLADDLPPADYTSSLDFLYPADECHGQSDFMRIEGRVLGDVELEFHKSANPNAGPISDGGTVTLADNVYANSTTTAGFSVENESDQSFDGELTIEGEGYTFGNGSVSRSVHIEGGQSVNFNVKLQTDHRVGHTYNGTVRAKYDSGQQANYFKVKATAKEPIKVEAISPTAKTISAHDTYFAPHLGVPPDVRVDVIRITNLSQGQIYVPTPNLDPISGSPDAFIANPINLNRTLSAGQSGTFQIRYQPPTCGLTFEGRVRISYTPSGAPTSEFPFTYKTESCVPRSVEFFWNDSPIAPPTTLSLRLPNVPNGSNSTTGALRLQLSQPPTRPYRDLALTTTGSGFSTNPSGTVRVNSSGSITVTVKYQPTGYGSHNGQLKLKDVATNHTWTLILDGKTCGIDGEESCYGGVCQNGLQECTGNICRYCCGAETNGECGNQPNGDLCSPQPTNPWYDADCEACPGTDHKWRSDVHNQTPYPDPIQPNPQVCLQTNECLFSTGTSAHLGRVDSRTWICGTETVDNRLQGVWYQCEGTRLSHNVEIQNHDCQHLDGTPAWVGSCPGTAHKWRSDSHGQTPYLASDQPDPANCLSTTRCLHANGNSVAFGTLAGGIWVCGQANLQGRTQGAWFLCEVTRASAGASVANHDCFLHYGAYEWIADCPGTEHKWRSDSHGQAPYVAPDQPSPRVCLDNARCLHANGNSVGLGVVAGAWICDDQILGGDNQGVWFLCEQTRASAGVEIRGKRCVWTGSAYEWQSTGGS
jgi:hypothetical protein